MYWSFLKLDSLEGNPSWKSNQFVDNYFVIKPISKITIKESVTIWLP